MALYSDPQTSYSTQETHHFFFLPVYFSVKGAKTNRFFGAKSAGCERGVLLLHLCPTMMEPLGATSTGVWRLTRTTPPPPLTLPPSLPYNSSDGSP